MGITMQRFLQAFSWTCQQSCSFLEATLWNGREWLRDGSWQDKVFDSRLTQGGPPALLADIDDLGERLDEIGCRLGLGWAIRFQERVAEKFDFFV